MKGLKNMAKLTRADITKSVAEKLNVTIKETDSIICAAFEFIAQNMAMGNKISVNNFGTFEPRARAARTGSNPKTKEPIEIPATIVPCLKPALALKRAVNGETAE